MKTPAHRKTRLVAVRFTEAEHAELERRASAIDGGWKVRTVSEVIRRALFPATMPERGQR